MEMELDNKIIDNFISESSFAGLLTLYFTKLRYDKKQGFSQSDLEKINSGAYTYGYFVACSAFGLFDYTINKDIFNITNFNKYLSLIILEKLKEKARNHDSINDLDKSNNPLNIVYKWEDDIKRIETI